MPLFAELHNHWVYTCRPSLDVDCFYAPYPNSLAQRNQSAMDPLKREEGESISNKKVGVIGFVHMNEEDPSYATTGYFLSQTD